MSANTPPLDIVFYTEGLPFDGDSPERGALGGEQSAMCFLARALAQMGHKVTAYIPCTSEAVSHGVLYKPYTMLDELIHRECDVYVCSRYLLTFAKPLRARVRILWLHQILIEELNEYLTFLAPKMDIIYLLSDYQHRRSVQTLPELESKMRMLKLGITHPVIEQALAKTEGKKHKIMFTSRPERGLWEALDIYEQLQDTKLEFLICTYPFPRVDSAGSVEASCHRRIKSLVERGFPIETGMFNKADLYRHIAESKVVIYPCNIAEVFALSSLETQACGTVYLTYDEFCFTELVSYKGIPFGDTAALTKRLKTLLWDTALRQELESQGRAHVQKYTWPKTAQTLVDAVYERLSLNATSTVLPRRNYDRRGLSVPLYSQPLANILSAQIG